MDGAIWTARGAEAMLPGNTAANAQPTTIRGLYGYDAEGVWWEQSHFIIYRGRRKIDGQPVLIKLLKGDAESGRKCLQREFQVTQEIVSDCVVKPIAFEQTERGPALIYSAEAARPLEELAAKGRLDIDVVLNIGARLTEAVAAIHKERLVHGSLNPTTIWLDADNTRVLLFDFGSAARLTVETGNSFPAFDERIDVRYMSPEQTGRLKDSIDQRSDIYSLGIVLYRLWVGTLPFDNSDPMQIIDDHVAKQPALPAELRDTIPAGFFEVILKALAKSPERRYQSVNGLVADLVECQSLLRSSTLESFVPGRHDAKSVLRVSRRLYGRDRQLAALSEKVKALREEGRPALLLVSGAPGVGKSALLGELDGFVRQENGRFALGKFDQYKRNVPYLALIEAFQQLIGQLLSESQEELEVWRSRILTAVGNNARVVIDVIPELERITGQQPPIRSLPPVQARNRFNRVFTKLIQAFAPKSELLCLVMDDLQWVDMASLELLSHVLTDPDTSNIIFAGAYRDNEVGPAHPLQAAIGAVKTSDVDVQTLHLTELTEPDVLQLIKDTFTVSSAEARDLAKVLHRKTGGDPLFLIQLLHLLCDEGLITFEYHSGRWAWDLPGIQRQAITQDVLDLLNLRLAGLQEDTRTVLATAACIGVAFEPDKVAIAASQSLPEVLQRLSRAVDEGLLFTLEDLPAALPSPTNRFRFLHDRIQQVSFDWIPEQAKKSFRLNIGRKLLAEVEDETTAAPEILSNLNYAWELIGNGEERLKVARLNLAAGRRARRALAYQDALGYISIGLNLIGEEAWQRCYELGFELHSEALECEYLTGNFERAERLFRLLIANARSKLDKAKTYRTKILLDTSEERYTQAIDVGIEALRLFKVRYIKKPSRLHLLIQLLIIRFRMRGRKPKDLLNETELNDAEKLAALRLLVALFPTAYFTSPDLFMFNGLKIVSYSLRHGISPISAVGFANLGFVLAHALKDLKGGYEFGLFALELAERTEDASIVCPVLYGITAMIKPWRDPIDEVFALFDRVRRIALEGGENHYANYCIVSSMNVRLSRGSSLHELLRDCEEHGPLILASKDAFSVEPLKMTRNFVCALQGKTTTPYSLNDNNYDEESAALRYLDSGNLTGLATQYVMRTLLACLFCRYKDALSLSDKAEVVIRSASGFPQFADHYLYRGLAAAEALKEPGLHSRRHRKILRRCLTRMHGFANNCPHNFLQHEMLLRAEAAQAENQFADAIKHYNRAVELAEAEGYTHLVGLANERAGLCCLANGQRRLASWYLGCGRVAYDKWGASAKTAWLDREYPDLLSTAVNPSTTVPSLLLHEGEKFDIAAALRASQILSSAPEHALQALIQLIRLQAGAETAQLLVLEGGKLHLQASAAANSSDIVLFPASSLDKGPTSFSPAIVNYVLNSGQDLMLQEADKDPRFTHCSYMLSRRPKSVLCSGIRHQGELLGVIYLEHTQITGTFSGQKLEWLRLLSAEVGLTVWSGRLTRYRDYVRRFAPSTVTKEIDANPNNPDLAARDRDVSILFADLAGYTRMAEAMERRQLTELINRAFSKFADEINRYEGILLEIGGDELFVLSGDEDPARHVWKAINAALAITRAAHELTQELGSAAPPIVMNMGINSGIASVGLHSVEASSGSRSRYGASGTVVNIAARVREIARDGNILITADAASRVSTEFFVEDIGEHVLKNVSSPVRIYRLLYEPGALPHYRPPSRPTAGSSPKSSRFISHGRMARPRKAHT